MTAGTKVNGNPADKRIGTIIGGSVARAKGERPWSMHRGGRGAEERPGKVLSDGTLQRLGELVGTHDDEERQAESIARLLASEGLTCALRAWQGDRVITVAAAGPARATVASPEPAHLLDDVFAGERWVALDLAEVGAPDVDETWQRLLVAAGVAAACLLPLEFGSQRGVLCLYSHDPDALAGLSDDRLALTARLVALSLFGAATNGAAAPSVWTVCGPQAYRQAVTEIHAVADPQGACKQAVTSIHGLLHPDWVVVLRATPSGIECYLSGGGRLFFEANQAPAASDLLESGSAVMTLAELATDPLTRRLDSEGCVALAVEPVQFPGERLGTLALGYRQPERISDELRNTAERLAFHVALALRDAQLLQAQEETVDRLRRAQHEATQGAKFRALAQMAGGVAHEFNNALGGILARAQILQRQTQDRRILKGLSTIAEIGWRAAETVRRLQEFTRERSEEDFVTVRVSDLWERLGQVARDQIAVMARRTSARYHVELEHGDLDGSILADPDELCEAVGNVLLNALEATPGGGVVMLHLHSGDGLLHLTIVDRGRGMTAEELQSCFDPFFSTKAETGVGLGLSVTYGIVSRHRGEIAIESQPQMGTTVSIMLPLAGAPAPRHQGPPHLLVIDDEEALCDVLAELLTSAGYTVDTCAGGREGIERFQANNYDLVCTDLRTEDLSGWEVIRAVKSSGRGTPVILLTGFREQLRPDEIDGSGVDLVLGKPFTLQQVLDAVHRLLGEAEE